MDFDTVHRHNILGQYSNPYIENPYTHQANDHNKVFSALSHQVQVKNHDRNNPSVEGSSWESNPNSDLLCSPFDDPFYPFHQSCFGKSNQEYYLSAGYCTTPFVQEHDMQDLHVSSNTLSDNVDVNVDRSRGSFSMMDRYQMDEDLDYSKKTSLSNGRFSDMDSCLVLETDNGNHTKKMSKRKRIIDDKSDIIKGQWSPEEDSLLVELVEKHGVRKWSSIAKMLPRRIGKQCRERWHNHLKPNIKKDRWSEEEDKILIEAHRQLGNKWAEIARSLPHRSENTIKNHWNATKRRQLSAHKNNKSSKPNNNISPLQNYIKSLINSSQKSGEGNSVSSSSVERIGIVNGVEEGEGDEESLKVLNMQFDLQKEMDFMEMLSYGYI